MVQVKGAALVARKSFVVEEFGEEAWDRVLASLPAADAEVLRGVVLTSGWYPFELNERLDEAIGATFGDGGVEIFERIGARSAVANLEGPHAAFLAKGDPERFLQTTETIYRFYYDKGRRTYEPTGPGEGVITTHDAEAFSRADCLTVIGWYKKALGMCGAKRVQITEESCRAEGGETCRYRVRWA
jgi:uncharacterized protein (TIGR02265 family)